MTDKSARQKPKRKKSKAGSRPAYAAATISVATQTWSTGSPCSPCRAPFYSGFWPPSIFEMKIGGPPTLQ